MDRFILIFCIVCLSGQSFGTTTNLNSPTTPLTTLISSISPTSADSTTTQKPFWERDQFAWITPLFGDISDECREASNRYVDSLLAIVQPQSGKAIFPGIPPALQMFDSNGRLPMEGFLSDTIDLPIGICDLLGNIIKDCSYMLPSFLQNVNIKLPIGYNWNPGSYEECLVNEGIETKYCTVDMKGPDLGMGNNPFGRVQPKYETEFTRVNSLLSRYGNFRKSFKASNNSLTLNIFDLQHIKEFVGLLDKHADLSGKISDTEELLLLLGMSVYSALTQPRIGMCFPKACTAEDINKNYNNLTNKSFNIQGLDIPIDLKIQTRDPSCYTNDNRSGMPEKYPGVVIFFYILFSFIGALIIIGTAYDLYITFPTQKRKPDTLIPNFILCFSAYTNASRILSTESAGKDHLDCMNGIRFLSMTWVVEGHIFFAVFGGAIRNLGDVLGLMSGEGSLAFEAIINALPSVDSFFLMSGLLTTYILLKELDKAENNVTKHTITFIMYYVHRYLRITMTYALVIGVVIAVLPYLHYGPGWEYISTASSDCRKFWWQNLLYINTLVKNDEDNSCISVSWYLVDDMMFHFFSPIIIYPMFFLNRQTKRHLTGLIYWFIALACFTFGVFYIAYTTHQSPTEVLKLPGLHTNYTYHVGFYFAPWTRYQAYLIGILAGYVLHHARGKDIKISEAINLISWQIAFLSAFAVVYGLHSAYTSQSMTLFSATMYNTFQRIAWNGALAWVIFSCVKGYGGIVNEFLSWSAFAPLSRLTFCTYLIHIEVQGMFASSVLSSFPNDFSYTLNVWYLIGQLFVSMSAAFILVLCFELPCMRVEKLLIETILAPFMPNKMVLPVKNGNSKEDIDLKGLKKTYSNDKY